MFFPLQSKRFRLVDGVALARPPKLSLVIFDNANLALAFISNLKMSTLIIQNNSGFLSQSKRFRLVDGAALARPPKLSLVIFENANLAFHL